MTTAALDWGEIALRHADRVFRAARDVAPDDDAAWDCVQEAFLTAVRKGPTGLDRPVDWLCVVARNHARHASRGVGRFRRMITRLSRRPPRTEPPRPSSREALHEALGRLSPRLRDAVILRHVGRMTSDVARSLGISESAAKVRVHRGLARLRRLLGASALVALLAREASTASGDAIAGLALSVGTTAGVTATTGAVAVASTAAAAKLPLVIGGLVVAVCAALVAFWAGGSPDPEDAPAPRSPAVDAAAPEGAGPAVLVAGKDSDLYVPVGTLRARTVIKAASGETGPAPRAILHVHAEPFVTSGGFPLRPPREVVSNARGEVALPVPDGRSFRVTVSPSDPRYSLAGGRLDVAVLVPEDPDESVEILLALRGAASGTVLDSAGKPVAGARVSFASAGRRPSTLPTLGASETRTDAEGRFVLTGLPTGLGLVVWASRPPDRRATSIPFVVEQDTEVRDLVIRLRPGASVSGRVVDEEGRGVAGALVHLTRGDSRGLRGASRPALLPEGVTTDADGRYRIGECEERTYRVFADRAGYLGTHSWGATATRAGGEGPTLILRRPCRFVAIVVDDEGRPIENAVCSLGGAHGTHGQSRSDADGRLEITTVAAGRTKVWTGSSRYLSWEPREVDLPLEEPLRIVLGSGRTIEGRVVDGSGRAPEFATIMAWNADGDSHMANVPAEAGGRFVIEGLAPGRYSLSATGPGGTFFGVATAETGATDVVLGEIRPVTVTGVVVGPDGAPCPGASVTVLSDLAPGVPDGARQIKERTAARGRTDGEGRFRFEDLIGGRFDIQAHHATHLPAIARGVVPGADGLVLRLHEGLTISGLVVADGDLPSNVAVRARAADGVERSALTDSEGRFRVRGLRPGPHQILVFAPGIYREIEDVTAGTEALEITVTVRASTGLAHLRKERPWPCSHEEWARLWALIDSRGIAGSSSLPVVLAELGPTLRRLEIGTQPAIAILARIGTPEAVDAMVRLFADPESTTADVLRYVEEPLLAVEHPGLGPAAALWFRRCVEEGKTSWTTMRPLTRLLARHGDGDGVALLVEALEGSGSAAHYVTEALGLARDPRILEAGLRWVAQERHGDGAVKAAARLIDAFGDDATRKLTALAFDADASVEARANALGGLASRATTATVARLLEAKPDAGDGDLFVTLARQLPRAKTVTLQPSQVTRLATGLTTLLDHPDQQVRLRAVRTIGSVAAYHTEEMATRLEARAAREAHHYQKQATERAIERIRKTLDTGR